MGGMVYFWVMRIWRVLGGFLGLMGILGATLYAHARPIPALGQAAFMALFHAPILLWLADRKDSDLLSRVLPLLFSVGALIFTGTIYLRYLGGVEKATAFAPIGGSLLVLGWLGLMLRALRPWS